MKKKHFENEGKDGTIPEGGGIIIPSHGKGHFFVAFLVTNASAGIEQIECYDSLKKETFKVGKKVKLPKIVRDFVLQVHSFWSKFVFDKKIQEVYELVEFMPTPQQTNRIDCGLFVVGICLHLLHGFDITSKIFLQHDISLLHKNLTHESDSWTLHHTTKYKQIEDNPFLNLKSAFILQHFPLLMKKDKVDDDDNVTDDEKLYEDILLPSQPSQVDDPSFQTEINCQNPVNDFIEEEVNVDSSSNNRGQTPLVGQRKMKVNNTQKENERSDTTTFPSQQVSVDIASTKETVTRDKKIHTTTTTRESTVTNIRFSLSEKSFQDIFILQLLAKKCILQLH